MPTVQRLYRGFSSYQFQAQKRFRIYDVDLVKLDLLNHIFTRRGSRVMMPNFGTIIPEIAFEPLDESTIDLVASEVKRVIDYDPRVSLIDMEVNPIYDENRLTVAARVFYVELDREDDLFLNIEFEG